MDTDMIEDILDSAKGPSSAEFDMILERAGRIEGLSLEDSARLLSIDDEGMLQRLTRKAGEIKERVFGRRIVLFAPLYLSNYCTNNCLYCGFRRGNDDAYRKALTVEEVVGEAKLLEAMGFKRVLLVSGEDSTASDLGYIIGAVESIYRETGMRIVHVNVPPMDVGSFRRLKKSGVGVYQCFQETYHRPTYESVHPSGRKRDYDYRAGAMYRAVEAGFEDVGIGALLGLYDYRFDCLATIAHSRQLYERYGAHAHTISVPRLRPAPGAELAGAPFAVDDSDFKKVVAVYRLAVPSAGVVVSTRESRGIREEVVHGGGSQISAASSTIPGGYAGPSGDGPNPEMKVGVEQFKTDDNRSLKEVLTSILKTGLVPSLCTACYRVGRTGESFTEMALSSKMGRFCKANSILTLQEYILDCDNMNGLRELGMKAIEKVLDEIGEPDFRREVAERLKEIRSGKRDVYL